MVADGMNEEEILKAFPDLESEDVHEALRYAAEEKNIGRLSPFIATPNKSKKGEL